MRVGLVGKLGDEGGGIGRYTQKLYESLKDEGIDVEIIWKDEISLPIKVTFHSFFNLPFTVLKNSKKFDIIHSTWVGHSVAFPMISKPKLTTIYDLILIYGTRWTSSRPHLRLFNFSIFKSYLSFVKSSDLLLAISSQTKNELIRYGFSEDNIRVTPLGVDKRFKPRKLKKDRFIVGYLGALTYRKGIEYVIESFALFKKLAVGKDDPITESELWLCGKEGGDYPSGYLSELAKKLGIEEYVKFKGFIPEEKIVETYNRFDVFVFGTHYEGFGLMILEAQRCGIPVIVRDSAKIPKEVSEYCLKAISPQDMATKIHNLVANKNLRKKLVKEGIKYSSKFTWERTAKETLKVYEELP